MITTNENTAMNERKNEFRGKKDQESSYDNIFNAS